MKKRNVKSRERYSIIISSQTDARKKSIVFSITRRIALFVICTVFLAVSALTGVFVLKSSEVSDFSRQSEELQSASDEQMALLDEYSNKLGLLREADLNYQRDFEAARQVGELSGEEMLALETEEQADVQVPLIESSVPGEEVSVSSEDEFSSSGLSITAVECIPMTQAIEQINADFQANINSRIETIKQSEEFDEVEIEYEGDVEGDSFAVNNWADVLSVYGAATMYDNPKFLTITADNIGLLRDIYNEMNQLEFYTRKSSGRASDEGTGDEGTAALTTLTIYVTVSSLTYSEAAQLQDFDSRQDRMLEQLMSPDYYTYFADLLGVDVYDGMKSEELQAIIAGLPQGTKGSAIVQSALIRLGHPYSRSRRGSGNYVDCSYFAYWAYNQAGITIPTSSVEQARYCNNNGYTIEREDLIPGDLVFWTKKTCHCGRWREIHHAAIYIGNNMIIEASSNKGRVVINELWGADGGSEWKVALYARPYTEEQTAAAAESAPEP